MADGAERALTAGADPTPASAGRLLRQARERQGLHIAALATSIKVPPKKLEALENDRHADLPDATFVRALAQTVCRALKIDAAPVLALLPPPGPHRLEHVSEGLNTPFRERPASLLPGGDRAAVLASPALWLTALVLAAALVVYLMPAGLTGLVVRDDRAATGVATRGTMAPQSGEPAGAAPATTVPTAPDATLLGGPPATPSLAASEAAPSLVAVAAEPPPAEAASDAAAGGLLQLRVAEKSWVEVVDGRGASLLSRLLQPGEVVGVDGAPPLRLRIGNAAATQVTFRGQPTELGPYTRDNIARLELR